MNTPKDDRTAPQGPSFGFRVARRIAFLAALLAGILSVLMIANFIQTKSVDPLHSVPLTRLMARLQDNPEDVSLKEEIRALDLLARKAYFTYQWQLRTGGYLLLAFVLVLLLALKYMSSFRMNLPDLSREAAADESGKPALLSRRAVLYGGAALFLIAFGLGLLSQSDMKRGGLPAAGKAPAAADFPGLEEIRSNWPGFRGPEGNAVAYVSGAPTDWDGPSGRNVLWKTPVPLPGHNSPIVWGKRIFLSGADRKTQAVFCFDADTGKILWRTELNDIPGSPADRPKVTEDTGFAAPTMTTDGRRVFVLFATGDLACLDFEGRRIWAKNLGTPDNHYGLGSSLIMYQDLLLLQFDQNPGGRLLAFKAPTGDKAYDQPREVAISWASPILVDTGRRTELILNANPFVTGHDPRTGRELWRVACMQGEIAPSPAFADGQVFAVNEYARLAAIKLGDAPAIAWEQLDDLPDVSSPLATRDFVFLPTGFGTVSCLDAKTGKRLWFHEFKDGFYSSPILAGDSVFLMDMKGVTMVFKAGAEFQPVSQNALGERAVAIPAFMPGRIYIRGDKNLYGIGK